MHARIALALGWSLEDVRSFSLPALRELVRPVAPELAEEITQALANGSHIRGAVAADMSWLFSK
jgi:hypothetical protein